MTAQSQYTAKLEATLEDDAIEFWWQLYDESFSEINSVSPCRQSMYRDEFTNAMQSDSVYKIVAYDRDRSVAMIIFGSLSTNADTFGWLSQDFFQIRYPMEYSNDSVLYFVGLFTVRDGRHHGAMAELFSVASTVIKKYHPRASIVFDCCDENNSWLPEVIHSLSRELPGLDVGPMEVTGTQSYYGFAVTAKEALNA
jgi:hypothetical protein